MCVWVLFVFQTYSRCEGFVCSIDFWGFYVSLFLSGLFGFFFLGFGGVIPAQENNLASYCRVVFDKTTVCNVCLLLLRAL